MTRSALATAVLLVGASVATGDVAAAATVQRSGGDAAHAARGGSRCLGRAATIVGTNGADVIEGTPGADVIVGRNGDDRIRGRGGNDRICGGAGNDLLLGDRDRDRITGNGGDDEILGGPGSDVLDGANGGDAVSFRDFPSSVSVRIDLGSGRATAGDRVDRLISVEHALGGPGDDRLIGSRRSNFLLGGEGADRITGGAGIDVVFFIDHPVTADLATGTARGEGGDTFGGVEGLGTAVARRGSTLRGSSGRDRLFGGDGRDRLVGRGERDLLVGGQGDDVLDGGNGNDFFFGGGGDDVVRGGRGTFDQLNYTQSRSGVRVDLAAGTARGAGNDDLAGAEWVLGSSRPDALRGKAGTDYFEGKTGGDVISGRGGDDVLVGDRGTDRTDGGRGFDGCEAEVEVRCETDVIDPDDTSAEVTATSDAGRGAAAGPELGTSPKLRLHPAVLRRR